MKATMGKTHQIVMKIVKQLDSLMVRDISQAPEQAPAGEDGELEMPFEIPVPTFATQEDEIPTPEFEVAEKDEVDLKNTSS